MAAPIWALAGLDDGETLAEATRVADRLAATAESGGTAANSGDASGAAPDRPPVHAVAFDGLADPTDVAGRPDEIHRLVPAGAGGFEGGAGGLRPRADALRELADTTGEPRAVLVPSTPDGDDLAAAVAARLRGGCVTDCLLRVRDGDLLAGRGAYADRAYAEHAFEGELPVVSLRTDLLDPPSETDHDAPGMDVDASDRGADAPGTDDAPAADDAPVRGHEITVDADDAVRQVAVRDVPETDLSRAKRIVAGGYGLADADGFEVVREVAEALDASVGASRPPVDDGWVPYDRQIGVTGTEIDVELYLTCAISGDPYHMRSVTAEHLLAINTDPDAKIFGAADLGVVGDVYEYAPAIVEAVRDATQEPDEAAGDAGEAAQ